MENNTSSSDTARFCASCGAPMAPEDRFCTSCGAPRAAGSPEPVPPVPEAAPADSDAACSPSIGYIPAGPDDPAGPDPCDAAASEEPVPLYADHAAGRPGSRKSPGRIIAIAAVVLVLVLGGAFAGAKALFRRSPGPDSLIVGSWYSSALHVPGADEGNEWISLESDWSTLEIYADHTGVITLDSTDSYSFTWQYDSRDDELAFEDFTAFLEDGDEFSICYDCDALDILCIIDDCAVVYDAG